MSSKFIPAVMVILLGFSGFCLAKTPPATIKIIAPRNFGYTLGDEVTFTALINTHRGYQLEPGHLPKSGPVNSWLVIKKTTLESNRENHDYRFSITYQIFKQIDTGTRLSIPALPLHFTRNGKSTDVDMPAWPFGYHALIPAQVPDEPISLQPEITPALLDNSEALRLLKPLLIGIAGLLLYLAWIYDKIPWLEHYSGPFGLACRRLKKLSGKSQSEQQYRQALQIFHRAINLTAGETVFAERLNIFFTGHPAYLPVKAQTNRLFQHSQQIFFASEKTNTEIFPVEQIYNLCLQYRKIERASRWG